MTAGVFGELSQDGTRILLLVSGTDWELKRAGAALDHLTAKGKPTEPKGALWFPATWATVTQLAHTFNTDSLGRWIPGPALSQWTEEEFFRRTTARADEPARPLQPAKGQELIPRPYQLDGAAMLANAGKFLLFDEPGTGKTATTILGLNQRLRQGHPVFPMIIIVPSWDVADVWAREIKAWAPGWPEPVMYGGIDRRLAKDGISVTTYATARADWAPGRGGNLPKMTTVICDEVHFIKNKESRQSQAVERIAAKAPAFCGLSGTPVTRDTGDLFPVLRAMEPLSWPDDKRFRKRYLDITEGEYDEKVEGLKASAEPEFRAVLMGQYRRVAKADVLDQLPPKVYSVRRVELPAEWRKAYDTMEEDMLAQLPAAVEGADDGGELPVMSVLAQLTRLSQLASSACDVEVTEELNEAGELVKHYEVTLKAPSWKADSLLEILAERKGQPVAVFANSRQLVTIAGELCVKEGYRCGYILGSQGKLSRRDDIGAFQAGKLDVILCTAGAGGLGITLTAAGTVVFLQRSWQYDLAIQPEDRAHRIGNHHDCVEVIDVIAKNTVDERVRELMREKGNHLGQLVQDPRIVRELLGGLRLKPRCGRRTEI